MLKLGNGKWLFPTGTPAGQALCVSLWWDSYWNASNNLTVNILVLFYSWLFSWSPLEIYTSLGIWCCKHLSAKGRSQIFLRIINLIKQGFVVEESMGLGMHSWWQGEESTHYRGRGMSIKQSIKNKQRTYLNVLLYNLFFLWIFYNPLSSISYSN